MNYLIVEDTNYWREVARRRGVYCAAYFVVSALIAGALIGVILAGGPK